MTETRRKFDISNYLVDWPYCVVISKIHFNKIYLICGEYVNYTTQRKWISFKCKVSFLPINFPSISWKLVGLSCIRIQHNSVLYFAENENRILPLLHWIICCKKILSWHKANKPSFDFFLYANVKNYFQVLSHCFYLLSVLPHIGSLILTYIMADYNK